MTQLMTSLAEIYSYNPCPEGWSTILKAHNKTTADNISFPLVDTVESNSISDVCWLLGKRKKEIQIAVKFARMCANSVARLKNNSAAAAAADYAADYASAYSSAASSAADYADAASSASADYAAAAASSASSASARAQQRRKNKEFLIQCINEFQGK
jgi:hypothetical protein